MSATVSDGPRMGYQPALDGLRAISVVAVILYHAGFGWMRGGFLGVEVFFVVSGFLITVLLIEERERFGRVAFGRFWIRRARRLLPALFTMLLVVAAVALLLGTTEQADRFRDDLPWALFYVANWGTVLGEVPYFAPDSEPLLRHLWSLAVEEQWYVVWPLAFMGLSIVRLGRRRTAAVLMALVVAVSALMWWVQRGAPAPIDGGWFDGADRVNFNYLSTITRSAGLLVGAALAYVWAPWRGGSPRSAVAEGVAVTGFVALLGGFVVADLTADVMYPWLLVGTSFASAAVIGVAVSSHSTHTRLILSWEPLVAVGKRSYGLYLWHWPAFVFLDAAAGSVWRFTTAVVVSVITSELCYRLIETPIRNGAWSGWWRSRPTPVRWASLGAGLAVIAGMGGLVARADDYDPAVGGEETSFELDGLEVSDIVANVDPPPVVLAAPILPSSTTVPSTALPVTDLVELSTVPPTTTRAPDVGVSVSLPVTVAVVGDSQAKSMVVNEPDGLSEYFDLRDGSLDGCSVFESGTLRSETGFKLDMGRCDGWQEHWRRRSEGMTLALIVLGAWDTLDIERDGELVEFGTVEYIDLYLSAVLEGIDVVSAEGAHAAVLEVPCYRPVDNPGAGTPPLPERGADDRVAVINQVLREAVALRDASASFIEGPDEWCADEAIATDVSYRWDGVHVYAAGAKLIFETITPDLIRAAAR